MANPHALDTRAVSDGGSAFLQGVPDCQDRPETLDSIHMARSADRSPYARPQVHRALPLTDSPVRAMDRRARAPDTARPLHRSPALAFRRYPAATDSSPGVAGPD